LRNRLCEEKGRLMTTAVPRFLAAGSSDKGYVRSNNEDRVYCDDVRGFFVVVDGMGGHEAGEHAAEIAVDRIRIRLERQTGSAEQRVREAIALANNAIYEAAQNHPEWKGMACVLTAAVIEGAQITAGHVGDSRLYKVKRGHIEKITHDHSPVGEREDSGELSEEEAMQHPRRNEVYRDVGSAERTPDAEDFIEIVQMPFEPDSALLLCSDGLSDAVSSEKILRIIEANAGDRWATVRALISAANEVGKDNVSAILVEGDAFAASLGRRFRREDGDDGRNSSAGETTDRMVPAGHVTHAPWYRGTRAYLLYGLFFGVIVGAALTFFVQPYVLQNRFAFGSRLLVVASGGSIARALESVRPGDSIRVAPGTYSEAVQLKAGVILWSELPHKAVIRGPVSAEGIQQARLEGFEIRGGDIGIHIKDSDVVLSRDDIGNGTGVGVEFSGNSRGAIFACVIHDNAGGGILVDDAAAPAIENNVIENNGAQHGSSRPELFIRSTIRPSVVRNVIAGSGPETVWLAIPDERITRQNYFFIAGKIDERPKFRIVKHADSGEAGRP
jgi:PPM family protein phosphatase